MDRTETVRRLATAERVAVISGAGISSESGIPTFRGAGGLWNDHRAEDLATPQAFARDPDLVWRWYDWRRGICADATPNPAHLTVADMDAHYPEFLLITQNVDGLHTRAAAGGSYRAVEIHGNIWKARCTGCAHVFGVPETPLMAMPSCPECGTLARPHIVWFGESYDARLLEQAFGFLARCQVLLVVGTSGMVSMPVHLTQEARRAGAFIIESNLERGRLTELCDFFLQGRAGELLPELWTEAVASKTD